LSRFRKPRPRELVIFKDWRYRNNTIAAMMTARVSMSWPQARAVSPGDGSIVPETFDETRWE